MTRFIVAVVGILLFAALVCGMVHLVGNGIDHLTKERAATENAQ